MDSSVYFFFGWTINFFISVTRPARPAPDAPGQGATARNNSTRLLHVQIKELKRQIMVLEDQNSYNVRVRAERRAADDERARKRMKLS